MGVLHAAAEAIREAETLVICAGAGMGVDSGLPDFRGPEGFWRAYPAYRHMGLDFADLANPRWFAEDAPFAWGFYGHRTNLYRQTEPHSGFGRLLEWAQDRASFVFTSNVDGAFDAAGFDSAQVYEVHGSIHHLQCAGPCHPGIWDGRHQPVTVDMATLRATEPLPECPRCGGVARPNILMFGDWSFLQGRSERQSDRFERFVADRRRTPTVVIECGAGTAVPTVRWMSERLQGAGATLVRINPRESEGPPGTISIAMGARDALEDIAERLL